MNWRNEEDKEYCNESATNCQGTKDSPSKTIQQWVKELKWTNRSRGRDPKWGGITNPYFSASMGQAE